MPDLLVTPYYVEDAHSHFYVQRIPSGPQVSTWVGIGGYEGTNLIQTGVDDSHQLAWYELFPSTAVFVFPVAIGDDMYAQTSWDSSTGYWYILIDDVTRNTYYSSEFSFNPDQQTADYITEVAPTGAVPSFSGITFYNAYYVDDAGVGNNLDSSEANPLYLVILKSGSGGCVEPSVISNHGTFTNYRYSSC